MDTQEAEEIITEDKVNHLQNDLEDKKQTNEIIITCEKERRLHYRVSDVPPFHLSFLFALQVKRFSF